MAHASARVLLVEDNAGDCRLLREMLGDCVGESFTVDQAATLADALKLAAGRDPYDLVLLDLSLPDSAGLDTIRRCRAAMPALPIVVLTNLADQSLGANAIRCGAQEYLVKGQVDHRLLSRTISYARERSLLEQEKERFLRTLRAARDDLDRRVQEGSRALQHTVDRLQGEVTAREQAEDALRESEQKFRAVFERAAIGVALVSAAGRITQTNRAFQDLFGYQAAELSGLPFADLVWGSQSPRVAEPLARLMDGQQDVYETEARHLRRDGRVLWIKLTASLIRDSAGQPRYALVLVADVTQRRQAEKQMADAMVAEQRRLGQELHDGLVQQLTGLGMIARSLQDRLRSESHPQADAVGELCGLIREAQRQGRAMLKGLRPVEVDAHGLMAAIEDLATGTETWYGIPCSVRFDQPVQVEDTNIATQLFYIVREAVANAVRHAKAKHIEIRLDEKDEGILLQVRDNGVGITAALQAAEGMGLRIMRYRASLIGATVDLATAEAGGTVVTCMLRQEHDDGPK
jgi:PAS domain S-box-containing protein